ncbi:MAG: aldehyde dehydrogenase [Candidatus Angelobacter sp.]|nr:aldehyde dehydrogenase [Candidatus Angelobacter sp.]
MVQHGFLVDGEWISRGTPVQILSPYDSTVVGETFQATPADLDRAIAAAVCSFEETRHLPAAERKRVLLAVADGISRSKEDFARMIALEAGKPMKAARVEVERAIFTFTLAAEESTRNTDEHLSLAGNPERSGLVRRFPIGPIAAITPFNFPLNLVAHKLAPAMAVGCTVVLKPAPQTPITALMLARIIHDAGWPAGALNVLPLANEDAAAMVADDRLKMLSFTGSAKVGWELKAKSGKKRVVLELGGNAAVIVHSDADIAEAATRCAFGGFTYAGQSCISVQRIFVEQSKYQQFLDTLVPKVRALKCGDPLDETVDVGPLIRESDAERIENWISEAVSAGAKLLCVGKRTLNRRFIEPAVLTHTKPNQRVNSEEIFGPVVTVEPYRDFDEALKLVNDSRYGLQAGIFTNAPDLIARAFDELEVGGVIVNDVPTFRSDQMPYGGVKDSGLGREGVRYAMEEMTDLKVLVTKTS